MPPLLPLLPLLPLQSKAKVAIKGKSCNQRQKLQSKAKVAIKGKSWSQIVIWMIKSKGKWNLKSELIKYCEQDCKSLWLIISNFNLMIYKKYKLNIHRFPTLPSLTMGIWLCHYLQDSKVPILIGSMFDNIKTSYTGGHTDVYKPKCNNVFAYDVNSLYPHVMEKFDMPIGQPKYFEGDIIKYFPNAKGFFECDITTPLNMYRPLLQTKVTTRKGLRTIAPLGKWTDTLFSEEITEYMKYGYKFKILKGYVLLPWQWFERGNIFKNYILDLYKNQRIS